MVFVHFYPKKKHRKSSASLSHASNIREFLLNSLTKCLPTQLFPETNLYYFIPLKVFKLEFVVQFVFRSPNILGDMEYNLSLVLFCFLNCIAVSLHFCLYSSPSSVCIFILFPSTAHFNLTQPSLNVHLTYVLQNYNITLIMPLLNIFNGNKSDFAISFSCSSFSRRDTSSMSL